MTLPWPSETVLEADAVEQWGHGASNWVLDFHGDPLKADLVLFSDGNHHMALLPALRAFRDAHPRIAEIFYATTPPYPIVQLLKAGALRIGNLILSVRPHVFISPPHVLDSLQAAGFLQTHRPLAQTRGTALLIPRGNPKAIQSVMDLMRHDVRLFISNPRTEKASYQSYRNSLESLAADQGVAAEDFARAVFGETVVRGHCIHHREAPQAVAGGRADAAVVYYHLALRYRALFPEHFDFISLEGTRVGSGGGAARSAARIHIGVIGDGGLWGEGLVKHMVSEQVGAIYERHGLIHCSGAAGLRPS